MYIDQFKSGIHGSITKGRFKASTDSICYLSYLKNLVQNQLEDEMGGMDSNCLRLGVESFELKNTTL